MKKVETKSGFSAEVDESVADDMAFLDLICALDDGNPRALRGIVSKLLGADADRLYAHVRTDDGRVPVSAVNAEIAEIMRLIAKKQ